MNYRILTFDGGGIRGIYTARLLDRIFGHQLPLLDSVHLFAGTSTGGIIAMGLASGLLPSDLVNLYQVNGVDIFDALWLRHITDLGGLAGADYSNANLETIVTNTFGKKSLNDLLPKKVLVPSFDLDSSQDPEIDHKASDYVRSWKPKFFHNFPGDDSDGDQLVVDVAMRTSAAPTYFPSYQHYVDGGVVANNPSMAALAQALDSGTGNQSLGDVRLLSLGTGVVSTFIDGQNHDWGDAQWAKPLISLMIDGVAGVADYQCNRLLGDHYFRLSPTLPTAWKMDDAKDIGEMLAAADEVDLTGVLDWLEKVF